MGGGDFFGYSLILFAHEEEKINEKPHEIIFMHCWDCLHPFGVPAIRMDKEMVSLPPEQMEYYEWLQNEVNNGHQPWRIVPEQVVSDFLINHLNIEAGPKPLAKKVLRNGLEFTLSNEENHLSIFLFQPVTKGDFGIWTVAYYVDHTTGETHFVDLSQDIPIKDPSLYPGKGTSISRPSAR